MIKVIIFDLDGVLADTESIHTDCFISAIATTLHLSREEVKKHVSFEGNSSRHKLSILQRQLDLSNNTIQEIDDVKQKAVKLEFMKQLNPDSLQQKMLTELNKDYRLAIASNSRRGNVENILNILGIANYFSLVVSNDDVRNHKPDPEMFVRVMNYFDVSPTETLILEDSPTGKYAARMSNAHLLEIGRVSDVTLGLIKNEISRIETEYNNSNGGIGK